MCVCVCVCVCATSDWEAGSFPFMKLLVATAKPKAPSTVVMSITRLNVCCSLLFSFVYFQTSFVASAFILRAFCVKIIQEKVLELKKGSFY